MTGTRPASGNTGDLLLLGLSMVGGYLFSYLRGFGVGMAEFYASLNQGGTSTYAFRFGRMEMQILWYLSAWALVAIALWLLHRRFRQTATLCALTGALSVLVIQVVSPVMLVLSFHSSWLFQIPATRLAAAALRISEYPGMLLLGYGLLLFPRSLATKAPDALRERKRIGMALLLVLLSMAGGLASGYVAGDRHATNLMSSGQGWAALETVNTNPVLRKSKLAGGWIVLEYLPAVMGWALVTAGMVMLRRRLWGAPLFFATAGSSITLLVLAACVVLVLHPWLYPPWRNVMESWNPLCLGLYLFGGGMVMFTTRRTGLEDDVHGLGTAIHPPAPGDPREA